MLSAVVAARSLGFVDDTAAADDIRAALASDAIPSGEGPAFAEYVAALLTLRQAFPGLAAEVAQRLQRVTWVGRGLRSPSLPLSTKRSSVPLR